MRRGDVYDTRFDPIEGSVASGRRPAVIVSRDSFNAASPVVIVVPCTTYREGRRVYPSQVLLRAGQGGLVSDRPKIRPPRSAGPLPRPLTLRSRMTSEKAIDVLRGGPYVTTR